MEHVGGGHRSTRPHRSLPTVEVAVQLTAGYYLAAGGTEEVISNSSEHLLEQFLLVQVVELFDVRHDSKIASEI